MFLSIPAPFRIAVYPPRVAQRGNPYFHLCHAALAKHGIVAQDDLEVEWSTLTQRADALEGLHLHWPEDLWRKGFGRSIGRGGRAVRAGRRLLFLYRFLRRARQLGMLRLWTVHNMEPHEGAYRWDRYGYRLLARECDIVVCHSRATLEAVERQYRPRGRMVLMPIGELGTAYPEPRPRARVLHEIGLDPERPVVSCLGRLRDYKGLELACAAIEELQGAVQLIVAGPRHAGFDTTPLMAAAARSPHIVAITRHVSDPEFADLMGASDAALLAYRKITGSAAMLSAFGLGRGVIASDLPYFRETAAGEPDAAAFVDTREPAVWAAAISEYLSRPAALRHAAARRLADRYSWDRCVEPLVAAIAEAAATVPRGATTASEPTRAAG